MLEFGRGEFGRPAKLHAFGFSSLKPCLGALADYVALKLRQRTHDVKHKPPTAGAGVDLLGKAHKVCALPFDVAARADVALRANTCELCHQYHLTSRTKGMRLPAIEVKRRREAKSHANLA